MANSDCANIKVIKKSSVVRTLKNNNNTEISDDIVKANFINSYFTSIGENLSQKHSIDDDFDILNHIYRISPTTYIFYGKKYCSNCLKRWKPRRSLDQMGSHKSDDILSLKLNAVGISGPLHQWLIN